MSTTPTTSIATRTPAEGPALLRIEELSRLLSECVSVDEVKDIHDKAVAIAAYYRSRGAELEIQNTAAEARLRTERRLGDLLKPVAKDAQRKRSTESADHQTLGDIGITHKQSSVYVAMYRVLRNGACA